MRIERSPQILALTRITSYSALLLVYLMFFNGSFSQWMRHIPLEIWRPVGIMQFLPSPEAYASSAVFILVEILFVISCLSCILGFRWRISSVLTLILSLYVFGIKNSFGHNFRTESVLILAQFCFVFSKAADALSLDSVCTQKNLKNNYEYEWPQKVLQLFWVGMLLISGLGKLRVSGWAWVDENYLRQFLIANEIVRGPAIEGRIGSTWGLWLASQEGLSWMAGLGVLIFELCSPVLIFFKKIRWPYLFVNFIFQIGIYLLMGVNFLFYFALLPIWFTRINKKDGSR